MKLKLDENGNVVVQDGKPVYVHDDGKEIAFDAPASAAKITELNNEARTHRLRAEKAESTLKNFDGIENPADALKALETLKNLDQKKLVDAGEVEKVKFEAIKAVEEKYAPITKERDMFRDQLYSELVGGNFARSKFIAEKLAIPADLVQSKFENAFKVEDGKVVGYGDDGKQIFSRLRPGEVADFDEAIESLVNGYPHKDSILKGTGAKGSGAGGAGGAGGGSKSLNRDAFEAMSPAEQMGHVKSGGQITD